MTCRPSPMFELNHPAERPGDSGRSRLGDDINVPVIIATTRTRYDLVRLALVVDKYADMTEAPGEVVWGTGKDPPRYPEIMAEIDGEVFGPIGS